MNPFPAMLCRECIYAFRLYLPVRCAILWMVILMEMQNRKLPRLHGFDYATPGAYFITICTHEKMCYFGSIRPADYCEAYMQYSPIGEIAKQNLIDLEKHYDNIVLDNWVIMPNHIHLLVRIEERMNPFPTNGYDISNIVGKYKAGVTRAVRKESLYIGKLWQSSFYDHIVRNDVDYQNIWNYINDNPSRWLEDCFYCNE